MQSQPEGGAALRGTCASGADRNGHTTANTVADKNGQGCTAWALPCHVQHMPRTQASCSDRAVALTSHKCTPCATRRHVASGGSLAACHARVVDCAVPASRQSRSKNDILQKKVAEGAHRERLLVSFSARNADCTLRNGRQHVLFRENCCYVFCQVQPSQAGIRQHGGVYLQQKRRSRMHEGLQIHQQLSTPVMTRDASSCCAGALLCNVVLIASRSAELCNLISCRLAQSVDRPPCPSAACGLMPLS